MRRLNPEEEAIWNHVARSVRPLHTHHHRTAPVVPVVDAVPFAPPSTPTPTNPLAKHAPAKQSHQRPVIGNHLDGSWDKKLGTGRVTPDHVIDLHGHTLDTAYRYLDHGLERAVRQQARIILLITGKPRPTDRTGSERRGIIRAKIGDWLGMSRFASQIAAIRNAHPRHGGQGALYLVLRRQRDS